MDEEEVPDWHAMARPLVREFAAFSKAYGVSRRALALAFVRRQAEISHIVFGIDNENQLKENVQAFSESVPPDVLAEAERRFAAVAPVLVMPNKWRKSK